MNPILKLSRITTPLLMACALLATASPGSAGDRFGENGRDEGTCSDRTIRGDYGFAIEGIVIPAPGVQLPVRGISMTHFDGRGNVTQLDHVVINGVPPALEWAPGTGTYHLNPDCTGTMSIVSGTGGPITTKIVVVNRGRKIHAVVTAPFTGPARTVTSVGTKVD
jgi:hypothetical protein